MRQILRNHEVSISVRRAWLLGGLVFAALAIPACHTRHEIEVEPTQHTVKVEPIYMTIDINLRVQRELDRFYDDVVGGAPEKDESGGAL